MCGNRHREQFFIGDVFSDSFPPAVKPRLVICADVGDGRRRRQLDGPRPCLGHTQRPRDAAPCLKHLPVCRAPARVAVRGPGGGPRSGRGEGAGTPLADAVPRLLPAPVGGGGAVGKPPGVTFSTD